jgi:hypothetical protein
MNGAANGYEQAKARTAVIAGADRGIPGRVGVFSSEDPTVPRWRVKRHNEQGCSPRVKREACRMRNEPCGCDLEELSSREAFAYAKQATGRRSR